MRMAGAANLGITAQRYTLRHFLSVRGGDEAGSDVAIHAYLECRYRSVSFKNTALVTQKSMSTGT